MGQPKALLPAPPDGRPFLVRIACALAAGGAGPIVVVGGMLEDEFRATLAQTMPHLGVRVVRNPDPSRGQLSSLWVGMDAVLTDESAGLLMTPVDVPMVTRRSSRR
jgi:CTP:molybdopterin cytidylyltransferase MocA